MNPLRKQLALGGIVALLGVAGFVLFTPSEPNSEKAQALSIEDELQGKTKTEKVALKSLRITSEYKLKLKGKYDVYTYGEYDIEVREVNAIDGGIEVFARAWKNGQPVGFGADGSVEIERFHIMNPPVLVPDSNGDITRQWVDEDGRAKQKKFRDDAAEALRLELGRTIAIVGKPGENIEAGKVGRTTTTCRPDAGSGGSLVVDGYVRYSNSSWDTTHDATSGSSHDDTGFNVVLRVRNNGTYFIDRIILNFDCSAITDTDTISAATITMTETGTYNNGDNDGNDYYAVVNASPAATNGIVNADFDTVGDAIDNPTELSDQLDLTDDFAGTDTNPVDFTLNATGIANISKTGISTFGMREGHDIADDPIGVAINQANMYAADQTGSTLDPLLTVQHAAGGGGGGAAPVDAEAIIF